MRDAVVLLVEDNDKNLKLARDVLEFAGFRVLVAMTGEEAVLRAREALPDLVLMDLQLPGMDGFEVLRRLRGDDATATIPVVALTAFAMQQDRERASGAGFEGYLVKPIDVRQFPHQVRAHLRTE
ncbi:MAG TPA: response regulator [Intrasporangium sp.]|uniref:response regulator n=1 Tax=Intrasporangium sp. TaxID=1925024 RepID=UPI002B47438D|nr:response regulator [Intrasporangium sp.]HKX67773.1 response regulator [Intrasporangium sp.]